jgi:hypothetical protein
MKTLFLAALLLNQDKSAEDALRKIEGVLLSAKSVVLLSTGEAKVVRNDQAEKLDFDGTLTLKEGNKSALKTTRTTSINGTKTSELVSVICDGKKMTLIGGRSDLSYSQELDLPANNNEAQIKRLTRVGLGLASVVMGVVQGDDAYEIEGLSLTEHQEGGNVLTYKLKNSPRISEIQLWYDPKTHFLMKRTVKLTATTTIEATVLSESYGRCILNSDISDETFKLQEK